MQYLTTSAMIGMESQFILQQTVSHFSNIMSFAVSQLKDTSYEMFSRHMQLVSSLSTELSVGSLLGCLYVV